MTFRAVCSLSIALVLAIALPAAATSYVMVSDQHLVDSSAAVVEARVLSRDAAPSSGMPATDYLIEVDRVLSGDIPGRNLVVRVPGGVRPDGIGLQLYGLPEFAQGERVLLFLNPRQDGTFGITDLMLGAFREVVEGGRRVAVRDHLAQAQELGMPGEAVGSRERFSRPRAAEGFARWIEAAGRGGEPRADYFLESTAAASGVGSVTDPFVLFRVERPQPALVPLRRGHAGAVEDPGERPAGVHPEAEHRRPQGRAQRLERRRRLERRLPVRRYDQRDRRLLRLLRSQRRLHRRHQRSDLRRRRRQHQRSVRLQRGRHPGHRRSVVRHRPPAHLQGPDPTGRSSKPTSSPTRTSPAT